MWQLDKAFCIYGYVHTESKDCLHQQKFKFKNCPEFQFFTTWITSRVFFWNDRWHKAHEYRYTALLLGLNNDTVIIDKKLDIDLMTIYIHSPISNIHQWVNLVKRKVCINFTLKVRVIMDNNNKFSWSNFYNFRTIITLSGRQEYQS